MLSIKSPLDVPHMQQVKTEIILRLNPRCKDTDPTQSHRFDREITDSVNAILIAAKTLSIQSIPSLVQALETSAQELLKQEWEKSKTEALSGKVT